MEDKPICWIGTSKEDLQKFPSEAKSKAGFQLRAIQKGSDNVFEDLGFSPDEALSLKIKADLMLELRSFLEKKGLTQPEAAAFFEEPESIISHLINGEISNFSLDTLVNMLAKTGMKVTILCH